MDSSEGVAANYWAKIDNGCCVVCYDKNLKFAERRAKTHNMCGGLSKG